MDDDGIELVDKILSSTLILIFSLLSQRDYEGHAGTGRRYSEPGMPCHLMHARRSTISQSVEYSLWHTVFGV